MRDGVTGIPTETLLAQYTAILTAMQQSGNAQLQQLAESIKAVDSGSFTPKSRQTPSSARLTACRPLRQTSWAA